MLKGKKKSGFQEIRLLIKIPHAPCSTVLLFLSGSVFSFSFFSFIFAEAVDRTGEDFIIKTGFTKFKQIFFKLNKFFVGVFSKKILRSFKFGMLLSDGKQARRKPQYLTFNTYLLRIYYVLGTRDIAVSKMKPLSPWILHSNWTVIVNIYGLTMYQALL